MTDEAQMDERRRAQWTKARDAAYADAAERVRFQATFAEKLLNSLLLAHGGAIVGLFTFIGNVLRRPDFPVTFDTAFLWAAFGAFTLGALLALAAYAFAFMAQHHFYAQALEEAMRMERALLTDAAQVDRSAERKLNRRGFRYYWTGMMMIVVSLILFAIGGGLALAGVLPS